MTELNRKTYYSAQEIAAFKLNSAPQSHKNVQEKAKRENWQCRPRKGKGGGVEYEFASLPLDIQAEILLKTKTTAPEQVNRPASHLNYLPEVIWSKYGKVTEKQRAEAMQRLAPLHKVDDLLQHGFGLMDALARVSEEFKVNQSSLKRWYYKVRSFERSDWLPLLIGKQCMEREGSRASFTPEAWEAFKADYFRPECPQFGAVYQRLKRAAKEQGWIIPSASSIKRKIEREIPKTQQIFLRQGEHALSRLYPAQQRSVAELEAMEWINGDGYQHNVFVQWHNGEIVRPKTWLWQDVRTRKILAYRVDLSENSDTIRLSLMDVIWKYGIPKKLTIDNTRAAANKWMTGGVKNRYRFKVKEDEITGIIPLLGIELYWTSIQFGKGHGQAKPIERAFSHGGLGELVDKHPRLAGFFTGENIKDKPENYNGGKAGASYEDFIFALEDGIRTFNEREERDTEICQGVYSFSQVFERDYQQARIRQASSEQLRILMLMSEATTLKQDGTFELDVGGKVNNRRNRYLCVDLIGSSHKKVVVKFDPQDLHSKVWVYSTEMMFLGEAECTERVAFGDKAAGREHDKARKQWVKANKQAAKAQQSMNAQEAARYLPEFEEEEQLTPSLIELYMPEGNAVRKHETVLEDDEQSDFEQGWQKGLELLKQEKGL